MIRPTLPLAVLAFLLAGCAAESTPPSASSTTTTAPPTFGDPTALFNTTAPPPADALYNETFDFFITYASAAEGLGTNAAQQNCAYYEPVTMANATATAVWVASLPGEEQLELVVANFQTTGSLLRVQGTSPLSLSFSFPLTDDPTVVSVQSTPTGAVQQLPVSLTVTFRHPAVEQPDVFASTCAF